MEFLVEERRNGAADRRTLAILACAYAAVFAHSVFLTGATVSIPTIWGANAVVLAGLLVLPRQLGPLLLAVTSALHLALEVLAGDTLAYAFSITALDAVQISIAALSIKALGLPVRIRNMRDLLALVAASGAVTAITNLLVKGILNLSAGDAFWTGSVSWITPNVLGMAMILPSALILLDPKHREGSKASWQELAINTAVAAAASAAVFRWDPDLQPLVFIPVLVAVFRGGPRAVAIIAPACLVAAIPAVLSRTGLDPEAAYLPLRRIQLFYLVLYGVAMTAALALSRQSQLQALLVRRQAAARAAQARAQAANQAKSEFLATISHEIRTPLNSILGFAALVADEADLSAENRRRLELVGRAGRSLAEIVGDLLDFAKLEAGRLELTLAPCSPSAVLRDAAAIVAPAAAEKGLSLAVEAPDDERLLMLDGARLRQILINLLSNAVKFTAEGQVSASLTYGAEPGALRFEIADTGIGIAPDVQARLFQRFSQADSSISRSYGGTGLGLAISRALVTQMGGQIGVVSALGQGARFWVDLQVEPAGSPHRPVDPGASAIELAQDAAPRVLLVDDHPMNRELGEAILTLAGCDVITAADGAQALALVAGGGFDVVLMDVHMPVMDGLAAARAIRAMPGRVGATPIIALSADALPEQIARCRQAGMDDHVSKPIDRNALIQAVARALALETA